MRTIYEWIDAEFHPLLKGRALTEDVAAMEEEEVLQAWTMLKYASERISKRLEVLREQLLEDAREFGQDTEKGGQRLYVGKHLILRERRQSKLPEPEEFKTLMEAAGLGLEKAYTKKTTTVLDPSKIENLINLGKLEAERVDAARKVTWALRVKPDHTLEALLEDLFGEPEEEEFLSAQPRQKRAVAEGSRK